jgi:ATP/maltotriose-dependent transcriptional regulator MalT/DNA-binding SARP family transcriptional activator
MAKQKQILAKLTPPSMPRVIERSRLFRQLDRTIKAPLTWIAAPPGAGKTTLLASYLMKRRRPVLWYRLDAGDADPAAFFHYLGLAVQVAAPRFRRQLPHFTPEYFAGLPIFTQRFFEALGARCHRPTLVVLDNYHEVPSESSLHQLLPVGIQRLPPHVRVVILSREPYPSSYIRLAVEQQLQTIPTEELELTRAEARQVYGLQDTRRKSLVPPASIDQLWESARGWVAGFILLLERGSRGEALSDLSVHANPQAVFEYLAGEVMHRLPVETQQMLMTMSLVPDFTPDMAIALTDRPEAGHLLEQFHRSRYFIERREDRLGWYRFHPLFREFLLRRGEQTLHPQGLGDLRRKAAALLVDAHLEEEALHLLQQAQAWDDYRAVVRAQAPILAQQGRVQTLAAWIQQLPDDHREADPWMHFWLANSRLFVSPQEASALYESAMRRFQLQGERAGMLLAWAGAVQAILVAWSGMKRIHELVRLFEEMHPKGTAYPSVEIEAIVAQAMAGAYMQMYTDRPEARAWLNRSVELAHVLPVAMRSSEMVNTSIFYVQLGEGERAQRVFDHQKSAWGPGASSSMRVMMAFSESMLAWWSGDIERCRQAVRNALDLAEREGLVTWNWLLYAQAVYNELLFGNTEAARGYLHLTEPFATFCACRLNALVLGGWADLIDGQIDQVWQKCRQGRDITEREGAPVFHGGLFSLLEAQVLAVRGQRAEAEERLGKVEAIAHAIPWFFLFGVFFLRAQWAFQDGDEARGRLWLQRLLDEGKKNQQISFVGWVPVEASRLFAKALEYGMQVLYVQESIRKWHLKPPTDGHVPEGWPWRVKIRTFGKLMVEVDGKPLEKQRKAPHRLLELLAAIVAFGGHEVSVSRLIDALWPEVDGDTGHENFKKSIARLRKLLGVDEVIHWQDGKISLNQDLCWVDVLAFEHQATHAEVVTTGLQKDSFVQSQAIALYTGPFLGLDETSVWADSQREQVRTTFIRLVSRHCDHVQTANKVDEAIRSLEQAVAVDPLVEPLYHRLIPLLLAQGRQADARRYYQVCQKACQQWGDGDVSPETLRLGQSLGH